MTNQKLDIKADSGTYTAVQRGIKFPDDTIIWGDPNDKNKVQIDGLKDNDGYNPNGVYYLDDDRAGGPNTVPQLREVYARKISGAFAAGSFGGWPHLLTRTVILAIGNPVAQD